MGSTKDLGDIDLAVKRSTDGGKTWDNMITVVDDYDNTCGNPAPVVVESTEEYICFGVGDVIPINWKASSFRLLLTVIPGVCFIVIRMMTDKLGALNMI